MAKKTFHSCCGALAGECPGCPEGNCLQEKQSMASDLTPKRVRVVMPHGKGYLMERMNNKKYPDNYGKIRLPGGGVDPGETPRQAAIREMAEELSLKLEEKKLKSLGIHPGDYGAEEYFQYDGEHGAAPGNYTANFGGDKEIELIEGQTNDPNYWGGQLTALQQKESMDKQAANLGLDNIPQGVGPQQMHHALSQLNQARALVDPSETLKARGLSREDFDSKITELAGRDDERYNFSELRSDPKTNAILKGILGAIAGGGLGYLGKGPAGAALGAGIGGVGGAGFGYLDSQNENRKLHGTAKVLKDYGLLNPQYLQQALPLLKTSNWARKQASVGRAVGLLAGGTAAGAKALTAPKGYKKEEAGAAFNRVNDATTSGILGGALGLLGGVGLHNVLDRSGVYDIAGGKPGWGQLTARLATLGLPPLAGAYLFGKGSYNRAKEFHGLTTREKQQRRTDFEKELASKGFDEKEIAELTNYDDSELFGDKQSSQSKGLWANIHAKRKRGEKPAKKGDKAYPDAKAWKKTTKESVNFSNIRAGKATPAKAKPSRGGSLMKMTPAKAGPGRSKMMGPKSNKLSLQLPNTYVKAKTALYAAEAKMNRFDTLAAARQLRGLK